MTERSPLLQALSRSELLEFVDLMAIDAADRRAKAPLVEALRFAESSNETAGEHFTPRDIVRLTTSLVFMEDDEALRDPGIIRTSYDPTAGTGGFLSSGMEYVFELNPQARIVLFGQELNPESYAICKGDMLFKGQEVQNIKLGNPLSNGNRGRSSSKKADKRVFGCKIFESHEFGYRRITIERPLRLSAQFSAERLASLRFDSGNLGPAMQRLYEAFGQEWDEDSYGDLSAVEAEARAMLKDKFKELKEEQLKEVLSPKLWLAQKELLEKAEALAVAVGGQQHDDYDAFEGVLSAGLERAGVSLDAKERKQLEAAITWTNPGAEPVVKKVVKGKPDPMYGTFEYCGKVVTFQPDSGLRDSEDVPLTAETARGAKVDAENEAYFQREVAPHVKDAWIDASKKDPRDDGVGIVGYEIPFNRHFYQYEPPRSLEEIDADLDVLSREIMEMLREVHS